MAPKKMIRILTVMFCAFTVFGLFGCGNNEAPSGGTIDKTDYNAPKEIKSKDITYLWVTFCIAQELPEIEGTPQFSFRVKEDDNGNLILTEDAVGANAPADKKLFKSVQKIIDEYDLVSQNGVYRKTAGLASEYQECSINVNYASGENLSFTTNNNPYEEWEMKMYNVFAQWFADKGNKKFLPEETAE